MGLLAASCSDNFPKNHVYPNQFPNLNYGENWDSRKLIPIGITSITPGGTTSGRDRASLGGTGRDLPASPEKRPLGGVAGRVREQSEHCIAPCTAGFISVTAGAVTMTERRLQINGGF